MDATASSPQQTISGRSRLAAMQMDIGNLISMLLPPLPILWFGGSMLVYALHRHHPDPRVGHYTQRAAYRFYGVMGRSSLWGRFSGARDYALADRLGAWTGRDHTLVAVVDREDSAVRNGRISPCPKDGMRLPRRPGNECCGNRQRTA